MGTAGRMWPAGRGLAGPGLRYTMGTPLSNWSSASVMQGKTQYKYDAITLTTDCETRLATTISYILVTVWRHCHVVSNLRYNFVL